MPKTLLEKMFAKPEYTTAFLHMPKELMIELDTGVKTHTNLQQSYNFILAFYNKKKDLEKDMGDLKKSLLPNGLLWIAYPKNKALATDLNRDILHEVMKEYSLDGVSIISINSTWSAMRFKLIS